MYTTALLIALATCTFAPLVLDLALTLLQIWPAQAATHAGRKTKDPQMWALRFNTCPADQR